MVLVGIIYDDIEEDVVYLVDKVVYFCIFDDSEGKMNLFFLDIGGEILFVLQFMFYGDMRKGCCLNYMNVVKFDKVLGFYEKWNDLFCEKGIKVEIGMFGVMMDVQFINFGFVMFIMDLK